MNRRALIPALSALVVCAAVLLLAPQSRAMEKPGAVTVHFFLVPAVLPDGTDSAPALPALRLFLAKLAGGYTELGAGSGGYLDDKGELVKEDNIAFVVSAPKDVSKEIKAYLEENFPQDLHFILVWKADWPGMPVK